MKPLPELTGNNRLTKRNLLEPFCYAINLNHVATCHNSTLFTVPTKTDKPSEHLATMAYIRLSNHYFKVAPHPLGICHEI